MIKNNGYETMYIQILSYLIKIKNKGNQLTVICNIRFNNIWYEPQQDW